MKFNLHTAGSIRLLALVDDANIDWNQRLSTATHLIAYFHNAAEHECATELIGKVDTAVEILPATAQNRAFWFVFLAIHDLRRADDAQAAMRLQRAEDLAHQEGLAHAEFAALQFHTYLDLMFRRTAQAGTRIARLETHPARSHPDGALNFWLIQTLFAQLIGDVRAAQSHARRGLEAVESIGASYFQAVFPVMFASALADAGEAGRALDILETSRRLSRGSYLEVMEAQLLLEEAYVHLTQDDTERAHDLLAKGLAVAASGMQRGAYVHRILTRKPALLHMALERGVEVEFVREVARRWHVPPPQREVANWPWPIRVRTLGGFEVLVHDAPIAFGRKTPRKTLALLKAIIAHGGSAPESALVDTFWRDEEGDVAARSLAAAVHRLRGWLGEAGAIVQQGGQLSLDPRLVWVDAFAFERALAAPHTSGSASDDESVAAALALYRGAFLVEEESEAWPVAMRERLRSRFIHRVADHAAGLEASQRFDEAIVWYLRGLTADNLVEPFYQGLMRCYHALDRVPEAVSAYRRLKQTLSITLGLPPSQSTEKLYQSLRRS